MKSHTKISIKANLFLLLVNLITIIVAFQYNSEFTASLFGLSCFNIIILFISQLFIFRQLEMFILINEILLGLNIIIQTILLAITLWFNKSYYLILANLIAALISHIIMKKICKLVNF